MAEPDKLKIRRVLALPTVLESSSIYIYPDDDNDEKLKVTCTSSTGDVTRSTFDTSDILKLIREEVNPITTSVQTFLMPNVGDECNVVLDDIIRINYKKTTNGGNEGYRVNIYSIGADRTIAFRRDTIYDNTSPEGTNSNSLVLKEATGYISDDLTYGSMRDVTRKIIVDYETMLSWTIHVYGFGKGAVRFIIERYQESSGIRTSPDPIV